MTLVKLFGHLRDYAGGSEFEVTGQTVGGVLTRLCADNEPLQNAIFDQDGELYLTDGGLETTLVFHEGIDLPAFAAFVLLENEDGCETLRKYYRRYARIARDHNVGFILERLTWRATLAGLYEMCSAGKRQSWKATVSQKSQLLISLITICSGLRLTTMPNHRKWIQKVE